MIGSGSWQIFGTVFKQWWQMNFFFYISSTLAKLSLSFCTLGNWCAPWPYAPVFYVHISFPIYHMFILCTVIMHVKNWRVGWSYASGTDEWAEHMRQELMSGLSIRVRNWWVGWAYASGTDKWAEHTRQELMSGLSIRVRNWWVDWAYASGTDEWAEHTGQELMSGLSEHTSQKLVRALSIHVRYS